MKKREKESRNRKEFLQRQALKKHLRKVRWRNRRREERKNKCIENARKNLHVRKKRRHVYEQKRYRYYIRRNAPVNFSIIGNHEQVIAFCNDLKNDYYKSHKVFVNMERVTSVSNESLGLLVSHMMLFQQRRIKYDGNFPLDEKSRAIVIKSGFLEHLYLNSRKSSVNRINSSIYTHAAKESNAELVGVLIESSSKFLWNKYYNYGGVYNALVELMLNTYEHGNEIEGKQKWWVTVTKDEESQKVTFSFLDYGRGIINTLRNTQHKRYHGVIKKLLTKIGSITNKDAMLLKEVVEGALVLSEKGEPQYGNGLHSIYTDMRDNLLDNVIIITNNVYADLKNGNYQMMSVHFYGTFISWEINKNTVYEDICCDAIH